MKEINESFKDIDLAFSEAISVSAASMTVKKETISLLRKKIAYSIQTGITKAWGRSELNNDEMVKKLFKNPPKIYTERNLDGLKAFQERKVRGLTLSNRVWNLTGGFKEQLQLSIDLAIAEGKSASELSRYVRPLLNNPNELYRRVRENDKLVLSSKAKEFHPGRGVYRSSYQNAMRLARTEINQAYKRADWTRWQKLPFVVGYEVLISRGSSVCPVCTRLQGKYPKDFYFVGWHPNCLCVCAPILCSESELETIKADIRKGSVPNTPYKIPMPTQYTVFEKENPLYIVNLNLYT